MKKRIGLFALLLAMTILITACGSEKKSIEGKWLGTLNLTEQFEEGVKAAYPDLAEYVEFEDLFVEMDISFVDGQMETIVRQESMEVFNDNFAKGMQGMAVGYWEDGLSTIDLTLEEAISESGMTEEAYMKSIYSETGIDKMITSMTDITGQMIEKLSSMKGTYTTPVDNELRLYYTKDKFEAMEYGFKGKKLNITIKGDKFSLLIECKKEN